MSAIASFVDESGDVHSLQFTPETASLSGAVPNWSSITRQGLKPLSYIVDKKARTLSFAHNVVEVVGGSVNVEAVLEDLIHLAESGKRVRLRGVSLLEGHNWWRIASFSYNINERKTNQHPKDVTVSWSLTEYVPDSAVKIGRIKSSAKVATAASGRLYTVRPGDTWYGIAQQQMGDSAYWPVLAQANNVTNAAVDPTPGSVIKIPAVQPIQRADTGPGSSTYSEQVPSAATSPATKSGAGFRAI